MREATFPDERLVRFALGDVTDDDRTAVEAHVASSRAAAAFVDRVRRVIEVMLADEAEAPAAAAVRRVVESWGLAPGGALEALDVVAGALRRVVAALVFDSRVQPALAGFRGSDGGYQLAFDSEPAEVDVRVTPLETTGPARWRVRGQVTLHQPGAVTDVRLVDTASGEPVARASADDDGLFKIDAGTGAYDLVLEAGDVAVVAALALG